MLSETLKIEFQLSLLHHKNEILKFDFVETESKTYNQYNHGTHRIFISIHGIKNLQ